MITLFELKAERPRLKAFFMFQAVTDGQTNLNQIVVHIDPFQFLFGFANHGVKILAVIKLQVLVQFSYRTAYFIQLPGEYQP